MDRAAAEREAIRLWRNLPLQERLTRSQASAFAAMVAPTLDFEASERRTRLIEGWLVRDLLQTETAAIGAAEELSGQRRLTTPPWPQREGAAAIAFVIAILVMVARRTDIVTDAKLWAEDGTVWFANAYNDGWWDLLRPYGGYLQLFPRVVFDIAALLPIRVVAIFGVWAGLLVRAALPALVFSSRFSWIDWRAKVAIAAYYLLMPNLSEVHTNVSNTHWYLGIYLVAVLLADAPRTLPWKIHDWAALLIAGLTGPMIIVIVPALALRTFVQRTTPSVRWPFLAAAAGLAVLQLVLFATSGTVGTATLPSAAEFAQLLASRVLLGFLSPVRWASAFALPAVTIPTVALGAAVITAIVVRANWRANALLIVLALTFIEALYSPLLIPAAGQWAPVFGPDQPGYYVVTSLAWAGLLVFFAGGYLPRLSSLSITAMVAVCGFLILFDFSLPAVPGASFGPVADSIAAAPSGQTLEVATAPPGWTMTLHTQ